MIQFTKMQGLGNDYVYMDCTKSGEPRQVADLARFVSNRHFGVGSDGLILICKSETCDFRMRMFNADGSEAEMCGNGIRCVGKYVYDKGLTKKTKITVETLAGVKILDLFTNQGKVERVTVDMGAPIFETNRIPVKLDQGDNQEEFPKLSLKVEDKEFEFYCVSVGNPHAITIVQQLDSFDVEKYGKPLEVDSHFPNKSNIEFVEVVDENKLKMRVWERGTGETFACGTAATACVAACCRNGYIKRKASVELLGGTLQFEWKEENNHIYMTGPAVTVFEGQLEIGGMENG